MSFSMRAYSLRTLVEANPCMEGPTVLNVLRRFRKGEIAKTSKALSAWTLTEDRGDDFGEFAVTSPHKHATPY